MLCLLHITYMFDYKSFKHITSNQLYQGLRFPHSNYLHARKYPQGPHPFWAPLAKRFLQNHCNSLLGTVWLRWRKMSQCFAFQDSAFAVVIKHKDNPDKIWKGSSSQDWNDLFNGSWYLKRRPKQMTGQDSTTGSIKPKHFFSLHILP